MSAPVRDIQLGLVDRVPERVQAIEMIEAAVADDIAHSIVRMTDERWPPEMAAGACTDFWEARFEEAFARGVRHGYELLSRADLVAEHDALEADGESTWCEACIERRYGRAA